MTTITTGKRATTGVQERRRPVVAPVSGRTRLKTALVEYQSAAEEFDCLHAKVARAEADMVMVSDGGGSEAESLAAIAGAQSRKALYLGRVPTAERKLSDRLQELRVALVDAMRDQGVLVRALIEKQREKIVANVYEALGRTDPVVRGEIIRLTRVCPSIQELERLEPSSFYEVSRLPAGGVVATAENAIRNAAHLEELI